MGADGDHITGVQHGDIAFDRQSAGVFGGVEKDRRDLAAENHAAAAFVGDVGNVVAGVPEHGVDRTFPGAAGPYHVAHVGHGMTLLFEGCDRFQTLGIPGLEHRQGMQGNVRSGGGVGGG